jgi:hypothetical protein
MHSALEQLQLALAMLGKEPAKRGDWRPALLARHIPTPLKFYGTLATNNKK